MSDTMLKPSADLVEKNHAHFPNESPAYRDARQRLLREEIELRRQIERVAELRRHLPPGGEVSKSYTFQGPDGPVSLADLFGDHDALVVYSYMFGPQRKTPCPMCASFMKSWVQKIPDLQQRVAVAFTARSPIERLLADRATRGLEALPVFSDSDGDFTRDYVTAEDADAPGYTVFTRRDGTIRHFWSAEMSPAMADPEQDPRGAPDLDPLWTILDTTPEGRGGTWYPKLSYGT